MTRNRFGWTGRGVMIFLAVALCAALGTGQAGAREPGIAPGVGVLRVGTFDSRAVALAYGRSEPFLAWVRGLHERADEARAEGNAELLKEIEKEAVDQQERLHRQVFSGAPIDDVLDRIRDALPGVAVAAGVDLIVQEPLYRSPSVEVVDITDEMVRPFAPDAQTLKIMEQLLKQPLVPMDSPIE